jgi:PEP-CTERM motif
VSTRVAPPLLLLALGLVAWAPARALPDPDAPRAHDLTLHQRSPEPVAGLAGSGRAFQYLPADENGPLAAAVTPDRDGAVLFELRVRPAPLPGSGDRVEIRRLPRSGSPSLLDDPMLSPRPPAALAHVVLAPVRATQELGSFLATLEVLDASRGPWLALRGVAIAGVGLPRWPGIPLDWVGGDAFVSDSWPLPPHRSVIPEPGTGLLAGFGLAGLAAARRRRQSERRWSTRASGADRNGEWLVSSDRTRSHGRAATMSRWSGSGRAASFRHSM